MPTDAIALLKADHRAVDQLFKKFEGTGERALKTKHSLVQKMTRELEVHTHIEEQVFYPFVRSLSKQLNDVILEALEEHHAAKATIAELQRMDASEERYTAKVTVLIEMVRHHVKEEEQELFPAVRRAATRRDLVQLAPALEAERSAFHEAERVVATDLAMASMATLSPFSL
jgi:iron-sulfur cluster repair protein YtfE (RIC family)